LIFRLGRKPFLGAAIFQLRKKAPSKESEIFEEPTMSADLTIIIPTRDRLWSLPKAVQSCRSSSLKVEIIVIDDGSTDGTSEWLHQQEDVISVPGDGWGKPWGIFRALPLATGTYIRYLDSDDWLNKRANESQVEIAERKGADLVVAGMDVYDEDVLVESIPYPQTDDFIAQQLGEGHGSHYSAFLYRREFVRQIPHRTLFPASNFASRDDRCFILELALKHPRIAESRSTTLCHRHHQKPRLQFKGGLASTGTNIQELYIYRQILHLLEERGELTYRRQRAATKVLWPLARRIAHTHPSEARELAKWIFELDTYFEPPERGVLGYLYRHFGFGRTEAILKIRRRFLRPFGRQIGQSTARL
jgi:glycosyltransferase involved in cell wall biosynthesis